MESNQIVEIENIIGYTFNDKELLMRAFTHSSWVNENQRYIDYERLEFVGDAALGYIVAIYLYNTYTTSSEGELTKIRASMVSADALGQVIVSLNLLKYVKVGAGTQVYESKNIKCDLFEAIVGAMLIDSNYDFSPARTFVLKFLSEIAESSNIDYKSKILEHCAQNSLVAKFNIVNKTMENNKTNFLVNLIVNGETVSSGEGSNKKTAEKQASKVFYAEIFKK